MWPNPCDPASTPTRRKSNATGRPSRAETRLSATLAASRLPKAVSTTAVASGSLPIMPLSLASIAHVALSREAVAFPFAPCGDLRVIARQQDLRHGVAAVFRRSRVAGRGEPALPERVRVRAVVIVHRTGQETHRRIDHRA